MRPLVQIPHGFAVRGDRRIVARTLAEAGVAPKTALNSALAELFCGQIEAWRDFFALRRGPMARRTLMVLAIRSLADDTAAAARLDRLAKGQGRALLQALELFVVARQAPECRRRAAPPTKVVAPEAVETAAPEAAPIAEVIVLDRRRAQRPVPPATDRRERVAPTFLAPEKLAA